mgnify:CR=1 FL=1
MNTNNDNVIFSHDGAVSGFDSAGGVVEQHDNNVTFSWDEQNIVQVDAPSDLSQAFDTEKFYKITDVTVARPIKQPYVTSDGEIEWYKKPADELQRAAWSFDNSPLTIEHPPTGMVKRTEDVRGFWRSPRYNNDEERLLANLYVPVTDDETINFIEDYGDVSVGFYNRRDFDYDGNTGTLTDDDVDAFQVDILGNHIAAVKNGRCSSEHGCGIDDGPYGKTVVTDQTTTFEVQKNSNTQMNDWSEGDEVVWQANPDMVGRIVHVPDDQDILMVELLENGEPSGYTLTAGYQDVVPIDMRGDSCPCATTDAPSGVYVDDGDWYGVAPSETESDEPKYDLNNCNDVKDAWNLRGSGDYTISQSTLEQRIKRAADSHDCPPEQRPWSESTDDSDDVITITNTKMTDGDNGDGFGIPDLSIDAIAEQHDAVSELKSEKEDLESTVDELQSAVDEIEDDILSSFDAADNFSVELDEDECVCEAVDDLVEELDNAAERVDTLEDDLSEYREADIEERLDTLEGLGADRDEWKETADEADNPLEELDSEIERREEVIDAVDETSVKNVESSTDSGSNNGDESRKSFGSTKTFSRGYGA